MFRCLIGLAMAASVSAPAFAQGKADSALIAKVHKEVSRDFKDPDAAKYRGLGIYKTKTGKTGNFVCGEVNAKNSYGAYVGFRGFVYSDGLVAINDDDGARMYGILSDAICHERLRNIS